jgi:1-deoxy-D-xylulose-5-phosphate synthase
MAPADENECRQMLSTGFLHQGPAAVRYPRGKGPGVPVQDNLDTLPIGKGHIQRQGKNIALLAWGSLVAPAIKAAEQLDATVANMRFVKPLDEALILELAQSHDYLVTLEENALSGGAGSNVVLFLHRQKISKPVLSIGLPDSFIEQGTREELLALCGLDVAGILASVRAFCG